MAAAAGAGTPLGMDQGGTGTSHQRAAASSSTTSEETTRRASELLPAFIHEWYLLMDANLDHGERNLVVTALNGNFNPQRAGSCLRARLGDETSASSRATDKAEHWIRDAELMDGGYDMEAEGCDHEEIALIAEAETQAQEALATMNEARRTLKEVVKQNRKYFGDSGSRGSTSSQDRVRDDSILDCLRCGHRAATCPQKPAVVDDFLFRGKSGEPLWEAKLKVTRSAVDTMIHTNMLLARAKLKQSYKMKIHSFTPEAKIMFVVWVDAANGNRMNGSSTHGIFVGATTENIMQWDVYDVTPCPVPQSKDRQILPLTRSGGGTGGRQRRGRPSTRFQWCEMLYGKPNLHHPDKTVKLVNGSVVTDSMQECLRQAGNRSPGDQRG
ncbi:hypothetical protein AK812_SmicGene8929 [Symbiodinium microadriaticum]|uniref:Uncharacterized protein n=1 Tax=Symbiodinium microadriaticum TaxID=2951 RepID=A0A1Q9EJQ1_SYMMI|nr:hypothetical protein AK812_SmicGene8929 [Symbiodinium microadriaticum]CAE7224258.1 unnamed protein product [Symbiodinium microadriaticum]CAE7913390.1 unnamed protein product [Symbiodinium sp. KB8]